MNYKWTLDENGNPYLDAVCEVCQKPAVVVWHDAIETTMPEDKIRNFKCGDAHCYCLEHDPKDASVILP